jgi:hypothetical protein
MGSLAVVTIAFFGDRRKKHFLYPAFHLAVYEHVFDDIPTPFNYRERVALRHDEIGRRRKAHLTAEILVYVLLRQAHHQAEVEVYGA